MPVCSVSVCKNRSNTINFKDHGVTYHIFPKDPEIKKQWIDATGRGPDWFPTKHSTICSIHFEAEMFQILNKSRRLFEWAVPKLKLRLTFASDLNQNNVDLQSHAINPASSILLTNLEELNESSSSIKHNEPQVNKSTRKHKSIEIDENNIKKPRRTSVQPIHLGSEDNLNSLQLMETPRKRRMRLWIRRSEIIIKKQKTKIKTLQKKTSRYRKKIASLKDVLKELNEKNFVTSDQTAHLENLGVNDLIDRYKKAVSSDRNVKTKYSPALRSFACTLHFYSPKAYEYVRKKFQTCLPHVRTIKKWYQSVDAEPGFTQESLKALRHKVGSTNYQYFFRCHANLGNHFKHILK